MGFVCVFKERLRTISLQKNNGLLAIISLYKLASLVAEDSPIPDDEPVKINKNSLRILFF